MQKLPSRTEPRNTISEPATTPKLVTIEAAIAPYPGVTRKILRGFIARGELAASKIGRSYFVSPVDVEALFAPKIQPRADKAAKRETPNERIARQLAEAGIQSR